jgi:hypothetical protein
VHAGVKGIARQERADDHPYPETDRTQKHRIVLGEGLDPAARGQMNPLSDARDHSARFTNPSLGLVDQVFAAAKKP